MEKHTVTVGAKHLGLIMQAFGMLKGPKSIMLAYKIGRILEPVHKLQNEFIQRIAPFVGEEGHLLEGLDEEAKAAVEKLVSEELTFEVPTLTLGEIDHNGLQVDDTSVLTYLVDLGIVVE